MAIGNVAAGKLHATITYVDPGADITLDYDTKNKLFTDTQAVADTPSLVLAKGVGDIFDVAVPSDAAPLLAVGVNKADTVSTGDVVTLTMVHNRVFTDSAVASDRNTQITGMLNGAMFNYRALGSGERVDDLTIIIS